MRVAARAPSSAAVALALAAVLGPLAAGATTYAYPQPSTAALALAAFEDLPLQLSAGPDGATISATSTGSRATVTAIPGGVIERATNNTVLANPGAQALQARLVFQGMSGFTGRCIMCKLQLRQGATTTDEVTVTNGNVPAAGTAGPWVAVEPAGTVGSVWYLWADVKANVGNKDAVMTFWLQVSPAGATFPRADYTQMQVTFVV